MKSTNDRPNSSGNSSIIHPNLHIVIEIGSRFIRAGFAHEKWARATIEIKTEKEGYFSSNELWNLSGSCFGNQEYNSNYVNEVKRNNETQKEQKSENKNENINDNANNNEKIEDLISNLYVSSHEVSVTELLRNLFEEIYSKYLLVEPKGIPVLIVENILLPKSIKQKILYCLFAYYQVPNIEFVSSHIVVCLAAYSHYGLVVDIGWNETSIVPVFNFQAITNGIRVTNRSCRMLHNLLSSALHKQSYALSFAEIEEFICRFLYFTSEKEENLLDSDSESSKSNKNKDQDLNSFITYTLSTKKKIKLDYNFVSDTILDCFIESYELDGIDDLNNQSIVECIISALIAVPIDIRQQLSSRIIFVGGGSKIPGLRSEILNELRHNDKLEKFKISLGSIISLGGWAGGCLYSLYSDSKEKNKKDAYNLSEIDGKNFSEESILVNDWVYKID